jgi:hypothetical protein
VVYDALVLNPTFMYLHVSEMGLLQLLFDLKLFVMSFWVVETFAWRFWILWRIRSI